MDGQLEVAGLEHSDEIKPNIWKQHPSVLWPHKNFAQGGFWFWRCLRMQRVHIAPAKPHQICCTKPRKCPTPPRLTSHSAPSICGTVSYRKVSGTLAAHFSSLTSWPLESAAEPNPIMAAPPGTESTDPHSPLPLALEGDSTPELI